MEMAPTTGVTTTVRRRSRGGEHPPGCTCGHCGGDGGPAPMEMDRTVMLTPRIGNEPHQHAMTIVGDETLFAVHMTQFYMEEHKYQLVFEVSLEPEVAEALRKARRQFPKDWFVLSNDASDLFTIPDLASGRTSSYRAQIFQGLPPFTEKDEESPHFYPWSPDRVDPLIDGVQARVERIVMFRPFAHHLTLPDFATYLIFGRGDEAHMTNLQTGYLSTGLFDALGFGPDYDHVMSLAEVPKEFSPAQLEAGVVATLPAVRLRDAATSRQCIPGAWPFKRGDQLLMRYRGILPEFTAVAGETYLFGTAVCSSASTLRPDQVNLSVSPTPDRLLKVKS